jgi:hypothetical protein
LTGRPLSGRRLGLHARYKPKGLWKILAVPVTVALIVASSALGEPGLATGIVLAVLVATNVWVYRGSATVVV